MNSLDQNQHLLSICSKKLEKNPYNIKALLLHAYINIKLNSLSQAENDIFNIINQNPNSSPIPNPQSPIPIYFLYFNQIIFLI